MVVVALVAAADRQWPAERHDVEWVYDGVGVAVVGAADDVGSFAACYWGPAGAAGVFGSHLFVDEIPSAALAGHVRRMSGAIDRLGGYYRGALMDQVAQRRREWLALENVQTTLDVVLVSYPDDPALKRARAVVARLVERAEARHVDALIEAAGVA